MVIYELEILVVPIVYRQEPSAQPRNSDSASKLATSPLPTALGGDSPKTPCSGGVQLLNLDFLIILTHANDR